MTGYDDMAALQRVVANLVDEIDGRYYGKYRGIVRDTDDPSKLGRLRVAVPELFGETVLTSWATPCTPYGGAADLGFLFVPDPGTGVWVEFEKGDTRLPIWVGCYWTKPESVSQLPRPQNADGTERDQPQRPHTRKIIKTSKGHTIQFEDADSAELVTIVDAVNHNVITMAADGITITDGNGNSITLTSAGVTVKTSGTQVTVGGDGVQIGGDAATEPLVLGNQFAAQVQSFLTSLGTHQHLGNLGAPTGPPMKPLTLDVPLSSKHKVE